LIKNSYGNGQHSSYGVAELPVEGVGVKREKLGRGRTVLVVDDVPLIRKAVAKAFLSDGFAICGEADNGRDAIDLAKKLRPDLIILDLSMPTMNGLQAAPELRRLAPNTPIILLTLYAFELANRPATELGVDLVVSKTEALATLVQKAHNVMQSLGKRERTWRPGPIK
jgi:DNA-binding NarL/FixJ family response regulator